MDSSVFDHKHGTVWVFFEAHTQLWHVVTTSPSLHLLRVGEQQYKFLHFPVLSIRKGSSERQECQQGLHVLKTIT